MAEKQTNKERLKDITDSIETGIKELFESDRYRQYLATMSRFHKYSVNNTMLIYMQRPDATHVAGFNKWRDQFGRSEEAIFFVRLIFLAARKRLSRHSPNLQLRLSQK